MLYHDGVHRELRGGKAGLNGGIEMPHGCVLRGPGKHSGHDIGARMGCWNALVWRSILILFARPRPGTGNGRRPESFPLDHDMLWGA
jgi:hypothetical protein